MAAGWVAIQMERSESANPAPDAEDYDFASRARRFIAFAFDVALLYCAIRWGHAPLKALAGSDAIVALALSPFMYFPLFEASPLRATPGKLLFHMRVINYLGLRISIGQGFARMLAMLFFLPSFGLWVAFKIQLGFLPLGLLTRSPDSVQTSYDAYSCTSVVLR